MAVNVGLKKVIYEWEPIHDKGSHYKSQTKIGRRSRSLGVRDMVGDRVPTNDKETINEQEGCPSDNERRCVGQAYSQDLQAHA